jgi:hypothetical protein
MRVFVFLFFFIPFFTLRGSNCTDSSLIIKKSIDKGVSYINSKVDSTNSFLVYPFLLFLKYEKGLKLDFDINNIYSLTNETEYNLIKPLIAFSSRDSARHYNVEKIDSTNYLTCLMYYCFNYPVVKNLSKIDFYSRQLYNKENYDVTHCYMALSFLIKRNNSSQLKQKFGYYLNTSRSKTLQLANSHATLLDLKIEAVAMLSEENLRYVSSSHINYILDNQNSEGYWANNPNDTTEDKFHSTVLALWALTNWLST